MNCHQFVVALLFSGLIAGCASTQIEPERTNNSISTDSETIVAQATNTATVTPTATPRPTDTPEEVLADTATPTSSPVPTQTALPLPSPLPTSTSTFTPTSIPVPTTVATADTAEDNRAGSQSVEYGLQVYKQQYCGVCHQFDLANTAGLFGPSQNGLGATAEQRIKDPSYTGQATTAEEYIRESILDPTAYYVKGYEQTRHHMPAFTHLSEAELDALVQMLLQQK